MNKRIAELAKMLALFFIGGVIYYMIEILWRGYSHWTMIALGGLCFISVGMINNHIDWKMKLWKQMAIGSALVTILEFIFGCILNIALKLNIWDYSSLPFNLFGQVCIPYTLLWFLLSLPAIIIDDFIRWKLFGEQKPKYYF